MQNARKKIGEYGELVAEKYLNNRGYKTITKNFHSQGGEIDLVMKDQNNAWIFVEVKTRTSSKFGTAKDSITNSKIKKMLNAIEKFFQLENYDEIPEFFIEAICLRIENKKVFCEHIKNIGLREE